jgi:PAS domain S-box-containing protein
VDCEEKLLRPKVAARTEAQPLSPGGNIALRLGDSHAMKAKTAIPGEANAHLTEEEYQILWATSTDAMLIMDERGAIRYANPAVLDVFGYEPGELIAKNITMVQPGHCREGARRGVMDFLQSDERKLTWPATETFGLHRDGREFPIEIAFSRLSYEPGRNVFAAFVRDITKRKRAEETIKESEERYRALIENFPAGNITVFDRKHCLTFVGGEDAKNYGAAETFVGRPLSEVAPPETYAVVEPNLRLAFAGNTVTYETPHEGRTYRATAAPLYWKNGVVVEVIVTAANITEQKQIEEALRESEERFRLLAEVTNDAIWDWDLISNELWWNEGFEKLFGFRRDEIEKTIESWYNRVHPEDRDRVIPGIHRLIAEGGVDWSDEYRFLCKSGRYAYVLDRGHVIRNTSGKAVRMVGGMRDLTERREAEAALLASEERFRTTFEQAPIGMAEISPEGNFEKVNPKLCEMFGYPAEELLALSAPGLTHREDVATTATLVAEVLAGRRTTFEADKRYIRKDGSVLWAHAISTILRDAAGLPRTFIAVIEDVTARKRADQAIQSLPARLLKAQDEERRRIARELHDSTAQELAVVAMNLGRLEEWIEGRDAWAENLLADSLAVLAQGNRDLRTLAHLLHPPMLEELGLAGALRHYVEGFSQRSGIRVVLECGADLERFSDGIETALFRVVQESLANVHRHSTSTCAFLKLVRVGDNIELTIKDRGRGLPAGLLTGTADEARIGVGISGMRQRMRELKGRLDLSSSAQGTMVHAVLPFCAKSGSSAREPERVRLNEKP